MYPQETTSKSIIQWCKPVHLIVIDLVDSGACSGLFGLREVKCQHWIGCPLWKFRSQPCADPEGDWGSAPNETMICVLVEDSDQPGAQGSCYTTLSAGPLNSYQVPI